MKKQKQKNNLGIITGILVIILSALGLMLAAAVYYQDDSRANEPETTLQRQPIQIPDITNPPSTEAGTESTVQTTQESDSETQQTETESQSQSSAGESDMSEEMVSAEEKVSSEEVPESETQTEAQEVIGTEAELSSAAEQETTAAKTQTQTTVTADDYRKQTYQGTLTMSGSHLVDLTAYTAPSAAELIAMIEAYTVPDRAYLDGAARTAGDFSYPISRRNLGAIHDPVELRYGVLTANASVRAFPTWQKLSNGTSANDHDALQETMLSAGEGVIVLHQSADQIWSFVQAGYYNGWIETAAIGFCSQETMNAFIASEDFAVITVPYVEIGGINLRMGTKLPVSEKRDGVCVVKMPQKDAQGNLTLLEVSVSTEYLSAGYLDLSSETLVKQAGKLLGTNYGWGDSNAYMDCTSTLRAAYNCLGITLPRNSSWMPNCALKVTDMREMSVEAKKQVIASLAPGSILLINGHAMMYIGQENGVESMLHNVTQYLPQAGAELVKPMKCVITPVDICNSAGVSYLELYRYAISVDWEMISQ